jgi:hypothetical protein
VQQGDITKPLSKLKRKRSASLMSRSSVLAIDVSAPESGEETHIGKMLFRRNHKLALGVVATTTTTSLAAAGPCDIYATGGTPCVAAHGTTRALYSAYTGPLYQVKRASDSKTADIAPLTAGGVANASTQDTFCSGTTCLISIIYDQSGKKNHLTQAPPGGFQGPAQGGYDNLASATGAPVRLNGQKAYGVFVAPGTGYRNNAATGTAKGDAAQGMYAVLDGTHYNGGCCFDYGNAETNSKDTGNGHMETIYFGTCNVWGTGAGKGPWIMADLENGLFSGSNPKNNAGDPTISYRFTTAVVKGQPAKWSIRGANAASGALSTFYNGNRPSNGYNPMKKEGAIILGIGGDNSHGAQGTFYEGVMTSGYPSDATENDVQANIVEAQYSTSALTSGPALEVGSSISMRAASGAQHVARSTDSDTTAIHARAVSSDNKEHASWIVRRGRGNADCYSFESNATPGHYLVHDKFELHAKPLPRGEDQTKQFNEDATFCTEAALNGRGSSIRSWSHPTRYLRRFNDVVYAASNGGGIHNFDDDVSFHEDASWVLDTAF